MNHAVALVLLVVLSRTVTAQKLNTRIIDGDILPGASPMYSSVFFIITDIGGCTGTAISESILVTAVHCVTISYNNTVKVAIPSAPGVAVTIDDPSTYTLVTSTDILLSSSDPSMTDVAIANFSYPVFSNYALMDGTGQVELYAKSAPLLAVGAGTNTTNVTGFGTALRTTQVIPLPDAMCATLSGRDPSAWVCLAQLGGRVCFGDSGGPVLAPGANGQPDTVVGVMSSLPWALLPTGGMPCATVPFFMAAKLPLPLSWFQLVSKRTGRNRLPDAVSPPTSPPINTCLC